MEHSTKLKDSTFAIIAEKKDSISHKWFIENCQNVPTWEIGLFYLYNPKYKNFEVYVMEKNVPKGKFIYNESRFEYLLKAEQENEKPKYANFDEWREMGKKEMLHTNDNAPTIPKQITISYNLAIEYIAERLNVDKGIIKIEM